MKLSSKTLCSGGKRSQVYLDLNIQETKFVKNQTFSGLLQREMHPLRPFCLIKTNLVFHGIIFGHMGFLSIIKLDFFIELQHIAVQLNICNNTFAL